MQFPSFLTLNVSFVYHFAVMDDRAGRAMEHRIYFIIGDVLACVLAGALGGWLAHSAVAGDLSMLFAMFIGMFLGMVGGMLVGFIMGPFFGAMEIMLPTGFAGMGAGMVVGMQHTMGVIDPTQAAINGAGVGFACLVIIYLLQAHLHGEVQ